MSIRQPIVCVLGHVDTGKTLLLDKIRKSSVQAREAGGITQHIGASFFPMETLAKICKGLLVKLKGKIRIPGLLVIDTPGHEAFANLRKRGGGIADIAILVIDIQRGFEAQTFECIEILQNRKTPFLVAANKIDRLSGWVPYANQNFLISYQKQGAYVRQALDEHIYEIMGEFSKLGFNVDRYDKIVDFTKTVAVVPTSAKSGEGVPALLAVLIGLTQQFLKSHLKVSKGPAKGTVLEVTEEPGLGVTINVVLYDGVLRQGDICVVGGKEAPIVTKARAILLPKPLDEIRDPRDKFSLVKNVSAAAGVKIAAPELEGAIAGAPLYVASPDNISRLIKSVSEEIEGIRVATDIDGVVLKTDSLGSLEAIAESLGRHNIPIRLADVGDVSKRDVVEASIVKEHKPLHGVILAFNVKVLPDAAEEAKTRQVNIFQNKIIYHLTEEFIKWKRSERDLQTTRELDKLTKPGKIKILPGLVFRKAKPAIVGVEILGGKIKQKIKVVKDDGTETGEILQIQDRGKTISEAVAGMQVAVSLDKPIFGRHIHEGDVLYVKVPESHAKILSSKFKEYLTEDELEVLNEFILLMREITPFWAV